MTNAPRVNQMRFLSSSALAKADQLILAASCSAADAMADSLRTAPARAPWFTTCHSRRPGPAWTGRPLAYGRRARQCHPADGRRSRGGGRSGLLPQRLEAAAGLLDRRRGALRRRLDFEPRARRPFADAKNFHAVAPPRHDPGFNQAVDGDRLGRVELAGVDRALNAPQVDLVIGEPRGRIETALRLPAMQRHLPAFEALDADARAGRLPLAAAAGLLALARADAAPDAGARL